MRLALAIGLVTVLGTSIGASASDAAQTGSAPPCTPSTTKLDGGSAVSYCGPATATLVIAGKTYRFKDGYCQSIHASGIKLDVTLGTIAQGKSGTGVAGNAGKPYFNLDASPGLLSSLISSAYAGGKKISGGGSISYKGSLTSSGTFTSIKNAALTGPPFSGSWTCHGAFFKG
jgi:hypothetical protein